MGAEIARRERWKGIKAPGTGLPGLIKAAASTSRESACSGTCTSRKDHRDPAEGRALRPSDRRGRRPTRHDRGHKAGAWWVAGVDDTKDHDTFEVRTPNPEILSPTGGYE